MTTHPTDLRTAREPRPARHVGMPPASLDERGIVLAAALLFVLLTSVLVLTFLTTTTGERSQSSNVQTAKVALYAADAGVRLRGATERRELTAAAPAAAAPAVPALPSAAPQSEAARAIGALSGLTARAAASTAITTPGLSNLRFEIRPRPQAWRWQRDDGELREVDDALQGWIAQADRTSRPHWQAGAAASEGTVTTLRFSRDGTVRAVLRIGPKGLRLDRSGKTESAELSTGQAAALLGALDALGP